VADDTSVDELIRFLQSELENTTDIEDKEMREKRQWQLESAIQESLAFLNDVRDLEARGIKSLETDDSVRVIARTVNISQDMENNSDTLNDGEEVYCKHCDEGLTDDLSFCPSCGKYQ